MEDCCAVCAEPLAWVAYGPCGHKEACSKCATRLRFVLEDKRCVICQQANATVMITRFLGDFTATLPADAFAELKAKSKARELWYLSAADAYFDDQEHFNEIRQAKVQAYCRAACTELCSYTHPALLEGGGIPQRFRGLNDLKRQLQIQRGLQFCPICLEGRKVFLCEQVLYSSQDLKHHMKSGDTEGPMAESGFKGHPMFCRQHHYDDNALFQHMHSRHEHCFICRRRQPQKYVYYRDLEELAGERPCCIA
eukprot:jgi/Astpho2/3402/e_gw1.00054.83.1_t